MKNLLSIAFTVVLALSLISCNSEKKKENATTDHSEFEITADNSRTSLDWAGTYEGELPCADCEGIKTFITIKNDNTYVLKEVYLGKDATSFNSEGTFTWNDNGQHIILSDTARHPYFVGENTLTALDEDGKKITGDLEALYVLHKVVDKLEGKKWHLAFYKDQEVVYKEAMSEHAYVQFLEDMTLNGYTGCNSFQGAYQLGDAQKIKFSNIISTLKACPEMDTEAKLLATLNNTEAFGFEEYDLYLYDKDHNKLATFKIAN